MSEIDEKLNPIDSPFTSSQGAVTPYEFGSGNERNAVGNFNLRNFSFSKGTGGTIQLGGTANGNGLMLLKDASGSTIFQGDYLGHHYYNTAGIEQVKVDWLGFHAYGTAGTTVEQVRVDFTGLHNYNSGGTEQIKVDFTGLHAYGTAGTAVEQIRVDNLGLHAYRADGTEQFVIGLNGLKGYGNDGSVFNFFQLGGTTSYGAMGIFKDYPTAGQNSFYFDSERLYTLTNIYDLYALQSSGTPITIATPNGDADISIVASGELYFSANSFNFNGTAKSAIVPTSKGYKTLYCAESPEVWFFDFAKVKRKWFFFKEYKIDPLFLEVTEPPYHYMPTTDRNVVQVWGKRKNFPMRFEDKTKRQFVQNTKFWSEQHE